MGAGALRVDLPGSRISSSNILVIELLSSNISLFMRLYAQTIAK
jgi:hypothetical protein